LTDRTIQFDESPGLHYGAVFVSGPDETAEGAARELERQIEVGLAALAAGIGDHVAHIEPDPAAPVEVFRTYDIEAGNLIVVWRVACRPRGQRPQ
jgi:hypothetical protein